MFSRRLNLLPSTVHIIGVGGTGSRLIPMVVQMMKSHPLLADISRIVLYDGDVVEKKNLARQNFAPSDVGQNKATVLARRYSRAYDFPVIGVPHMFNSHSENFDENANRLLSKVLDSDTARAIAYGSRVVIFGVDNVQARLDIIQSLVRSDHRKQNSVSDDGGPYYSAHTLVIDAGNENTFGQVMAFEPVVAAKYSRDVSGSRLGRWTKDFNVFKDSATSELPLTNCPIPVPVEHYYRIATAESVSDASCADLDQTLAVNAQMAIGIITVLQNVLLNHPIKHHAWFYDLHNGNSQLRLDREWFNNAWGYTEQTGNPFSSTMDVPTRLLRIEGTYQTVDEMGYDDKLDDRYKSGGNGALHFLASKAKTVSEGTLHRFLASVSSRSGRSPAILSNYLEWLAVEVSGGNITKVDDNLKALLLGNGPDTPEPVEVPQEVRDALLNADVEV